MLAFSHPDYPVPTLVSAPLDLIGGIPLITAVGTPRAIGEAIGARCKPRLQVLAQYLREQLASAMTGSGHRITADSLHDHLQAIALPLSRQEPALWMEIETMARVAELTPGDLLLIHGFGDLLSHYGCPVPPMRSSLILLSGTNTDTGEARLVHAWHLDPALFPYLTLVRRIPSHGPANITLTLAGLHPVVGLSEAGISAASNEIRVTDGSEGQFTTHLLASVFSSPTFEDAAQRIRKGPRHGGAAMHLLSASGQRLSVEVSGQEAEVLGDPNPQSPRVHTTHPVNVNILRWSAATGDGTSKGRLAHLASKAIEARGLTTSQCTAWFGLGTEDGPNGQRAYLPEGVDPRTTVLTQIDPRSRTLTLKRGGTPAPVESIQL